MGQRRQRPAAPVPQRRALRRRRGFNESRRRSDGCGSRVEADAAAAAGDGRLEAHDLRPAATAGRSRAGRDPAVSGPAPGSRRSRQRCGHAGGGKCAFGVCVCVRVRARVSSVIILGCVPSFCVCGVCVAGGGCGRDREEVGLAGPGRVRRGPEGQHVVPHVAVRPGVRHHLLPPPAPPVKATRAAHPRPADIAEGVPRSSPPAGPGRAPASTIPARMAPHGGGGGGGHLGAQGPGRPAIAGPDQPAVRRIHVPPPCPRRRPFPVRTSPRARPRPSGLARAAGACTGRPQTPASGRKSWAGCRARGSAAGP